MLKNKTYVPGISRLHVRIEENRDGGMMNELLGGRIRELRSAKSFTQEQIAEKIDDHATISENSPDEKEQEDEKFFDLCR